MLFVRLYLSLFVITLLSFTLSQSKGKSFKVYCSLALTLLYAPKDVITSISDALFCSNYQIVTVSERAQLVEGDVLLSATDCC